MLTDVSGQNRSGTGVTWCCATCTIITQLCHSTQNNRRFNNRQLFIVMSICFVRLQNLKIIIIIIINEFHRDASL